RGLSRRVPAGGYTGRCRCRHDPDERDGAGRYLGCVPRLPEGDSLLRAGSAAAARAAGPAPGGMMPAFFVVRAVVAQSDRPQFDEWYRAEHLPDAARAFAAQAAWRAWSRTDPSVHYAYYRFADVADAEAVSKSPAIGKLAAEFDARWGTRV